MCWPIFQQSHQKFHAVHEQQRGLLHTHQSHLEKSAEALQSTLDSFNNMHFLSTFSWPREVATRLAKTSGHQKQTCSEGVYCAEEKNIIAAAFALTHLHLPLLLLLLLHVSAPGRNQISALIGATGTFYKPIYVRCTLLFRSKHLSNSKRMGRPNHTVLAWCQKEAPWC